MVAAVAIKYIRTAIQLAKFLEFLTFVTHAKLANTEFLTTTELDVTKLITSRNEFSTEYYTNSRYKNAANLCLEDLRFPKYIGYKV